MIAIIILTTGVLSILFLALGISKLETRVEGMKINEREKLVTIIRNKKYYSFISAFVGINLIIGLFTIRKNEKYLLLLGLLIFFIGILVLDTLKRTL